MDLLDRLLEHDRWTTRQVLAICSTLPPEQLHQPIAIGHGTIDETLRHMIRNVQVWTDLMCTRPIRPRDPVEHAGIVELAEIFETSYTDFADSARQTARREPAGRHVSRRAGRTAYTQDHRRHHRPRDHA